MTQVKVRLLTRIDSIINSEVSDWLDELVDPNRYTFEWIHEPGWIQYGPNSTEYKTFLFDFKDSHNAVLFKLRFGGQ